MYGILYKVLIELYNILNFFKARECKKWSSHCLGWKIHPYGRCISFCDKSIDSCSSALQAETYHASMYIVFENLSGVWGFYIFEIFGYSWEKLQYILSAEKFIFIDFFAVKVDGYDVKPGICLYENLCTDSWVDVTSVNFNSKNVLEDKMFG